jgi:hypothetical protein
MQIKFQDSFGGTLAGKPSNPLVILDLTLSLSSGINLK